MGGGEGGAFPNLRVGISIAGIMEDNRKLKPSKTSKSIPTYNQKFFLLFNISGIKKYTFK